MSRDALEYAKLVKQLVNDGDPTTDFFVATRGADRFDGGGGSDTVSYSMSNARVFVSLSDTALETRGFAQGDLLISIENVIGSTYDDNILGSDRDNIIHGNQGNDTIDGNGGHDRIYGGEGKDILQVTTGTADFSIVDGGSGNDILVANMSGGLAEITTGTGLDLVSVRVNTSDFFHVEITDFQQDLYFDYTQMRLSTIGDRLQLSINTDLVTSTNVAPAVEFRPAGDDLILRFDSEGLHGEGLHGEVVLKDFIEVAGTALPLFRVDFDFFTLTV